MIKCIDYELTIGFRSDNQSAVELPRMDKKRNLLQLCKTGGPLTADDMLHGPRQLLFTCNAQ